MGRIAISFVGDLAVQTGESTVIVDSDSSYVDGCRSIDSAVRGDEPIDIWVRTRNHFVWLQNFTGQLGIDADFAEKTARPPFPHALRWHGPWPEASSACQQGATSQERPVGCRSPPPAAAHLNQVPLWSEPRSALEEPMTPVGQRSPAARAP